MGGGVVFFILEKSRNFVRHRINEGGGRICSFLDAMIPYSIIPGTLSRRLEDVFPRNAGLRKNFWLETS